MQGFFTSAKVQLQKVSPILNCFAYLLFITLITKRVFLIADMTKLVAKYKYQIILAIFFLSMILGIPLNKWTTSYLDGKG